MAFQVHLLGFLYLALLFIQQCNYMSCSESYLYKSFARIKIGQSWTPHLPSYRQNNVMLHSLTVLSHLFLVWYSENDSFQVVSMLLIVYTASVLFYSYIVPLTKFLRLQHMNLCHVELSYYDSLLYCTINEYMSAWTDFTCF